MLHLFSEQSINVPSILEQKCAVVCVFVCSGKLKQNKLCRLNIDSSNSKQQNCSRRLLLKITMEKMRKTKIARTPTKQTTRNRHIIRQSNLLNGKHSSIIEYTECHTHQSTIIGLRAQNIAHDVLPLDEYQPIEIDSYAENIVVSV